MRVMSPLFWNSTIWRKSLSRSFQVMPSVKNKNAVSGRLAATMARMSPRMSVIFDPVAP